MTEAKDEFRRLFAAAKLADPDRHDDTGQASLARHLGVSAVTVNRWLTDRKDSLEPPRSVILFLRAFNRLNDKERAAVLAG